MIWIESSGHRKQKGQEGLEGEHSTVLNFRSAQKVRLLPESQRLVAPQGYCTLWASALWISSCSSQTNAEDNFPSALKHVESETLLNLKMSEWFPPGLQMLSFSLLQRNAASSTFALECPVQNTPGSEFETAETRGMVNQSTNLMLEWVQLWTLILIFYVTWAMVSDPFSSSENSDDIYLDRFSWWLSLEIHTKHLKKNV